jgi:hypothetical protein
VTDLGGGVHEHQDPWADQGYEPHEHGPAPGPDRDRYPRCPFCSHDGRHDINTGPLGGLICGACGNQFTSAPGEYEAMAARRAMWAEMTRDRSHDHDETEEEVHR